MASSRGWTAGPARGRAGAAGRLVAPCDRPGGGRQTPATIGQLVPARERDFARAGVDGRDGRLQAQVDRIVGIEALVAKRQPLLPRAAGAMILRQIGAIDRLGVVA